ncbi:Asp23/Gls24 family envelope stress response protein [Rathayibacter sp. VKM Ac-2754]|uniref:Asp23/Gls24 family envelope stress response protein n=1 Tax=Rathayibacter sp. VKM Ac-2754 TaxID=2609251 RepID=UPI0013569C01|nr:Asp23/Gls24 family envelope stress response protein [Rathayibacter sp. VKM Ac-2754]MWV58739.1 Asp23/Gls24 family envelope stress response protein [Rathayibacter sp. VKM Ac-2754]
MTDSVVDHSIDLSGADRSHPEGESTERLVATAAAETAAGVTGVHHLGGTAARTLDRAARAVLGTSTSPGVTVSRADGVVTVDLDLVVEYPHKVREVIEATREQVSRAAAQVAAGPVVVNVTVTDVHGPFDPIEVPDDEREDGEPLVDKARDAASNAAAAAGDALDSARGSAGDALDSARESAGNALDAARDAVDTARASTADALDSAADAVEEDREAAVTRDVSAERTVGVEAPAAAEFVVRVEVEPVDPGADAAPAPVSVEVEPVESESVEADSSDTRASHRAGQE